MCAAIFILVSNKSIVHIKMTIINTVALNFSESLSFYGSLGFDKKIVDGGAYVYDSSVVIFISTKTSHRLGLSLMQPDWSSELEAVRVYTEPVVVDDHFLVSDSSGIHIKLLPIQSQLPQSSKNSILGNFSGVSLEVVEFDRSKLIWEALGYQQSAGDANQGWIVLSKEDNLSVGLIKAGACPHIFTNPGLNYFNGTNNLDVIKKVRATGGSIAEEITAFSKTGEVDNVILQDQAGLSFFLFSD